MFISIYTPNRVTPSAVFDLKKKRFISNPLGLGFSGSLSADLAHHECHGYKASVSSLEKLPRNTRGSIEAKQIPVRLALESLQATLATALKPRGRKAGNPALPLRGGLTTDNRHQRPKVITEGLLKSAFDLRAEGHPWRVVATALGVGMAALKTAHQRMASA